MNDEYHEKTIVQKTKVVVQELMPNDYSKQDQQNQRKQFERCDHTNTIKEDHIDIYNDDDSKCKHNGCQVLLFQLTHRMRSNDIHVSYGSSYDDAYCDGCNNLDTSDRFGKDSDVQVVKNINLFSDYDDDVGNDSDDTHGFTITNYDSNSNNNNEYNRDIFHDYIQAEDMIDDTYNDDDDDDVNRKPINNVIDHGEQRLTLYIINYVVSDSSTSNECIKQLGKEQ